MPYTNGGDETHLQEYSLKDAKTNYMTFGSRLWAQSFTPAVNFYLYAVSLKLFTFGYPGLITASIHNCNSYGNPLPTPLDSQTVDTEHPEWLQPLWRVFYFAQMPLLQWGRRYAIVLKAPWANPLNFLMWRGQAYDDPYNAGTIMFSPDDGTTWEKHYQEDACFKTWGFQPPTEPPPTPAVSNWAILNVEQAQLADGYKITVTTDTYCHLWLRWTDISPQIHREAVMRRGRMWHSDLRFCFVAYHENEQEEPGDTLVHTFYKRNWPVCQTRWFYFVGSRLDTAQPSTSPVLQKHFSGTGWTLIFEEPWTRTIISPPQYDMLYEEPWTV